MMSVESNLTILFTAKKMYRETLLAMNKADVLAPSAYSLT